MITGIVLAGGESKRAQTNKMMLNLYDKPLILHTIDSMRPHVDKIVVVTGCFDEELRPILKDVEVVYNENYKKGMFSSVQAGVKASEGNFFIIPGDCPFVKETTFKALKRKGNFSIRVPVFNEKNGHPTYFHSSMKEVILKEDVESNLKEIRDRVGYEKIEVKDSAIHNDIDTIFDYQQMLNKLERN